MDASTERRCREETEGEGGFYKPWSEAWTEPFLTVLAGDLPCQHPGLDFRPPEL